MHILVITSWYKTDEDPLSAAPFIEDQARTLLEAGHKVGVLHLNWSGSFLARVRSRPKLSYVEDKKLPTYHLNLDNVVPASNKINFIYFCKRARTTFNSYCKSFGKPDILHAHCVFIGGVVSNHLSKKFDIPFVVTEHSSELIIRPPEGYLYNQVREVIANARKWVTVSHFLGKEFQSNYRLTNDSLQVIPNVVHEQFFKKSKLPEATPFTWICIGLLAEVKNHTMLLNAFHLLHKKRPECKLVIVGDGALREKLVSLSRELKIGEKVHFTGFKNRSEVKALLDNSHALVSSSKLETFGVAIAEALAGGRPVVATDSGGPSEFITKNEGINVKKHTAEQLSQAMEQLMINYHTYDTNNISNTCKHLFTKEVILPQLMEMYQGALNNGLKKI